MPPAEKLASLCRCKIRQGDAIKAAGKATSSPHQSGSTHFNVICSGFDFGGLRLFNFSRFSIRLTLFFTLHSFVEVPIEEIQAG